MIGGCPVSLRRAGDTAINNQVAMMLVNLATTEADPVRRLFKVARSARQANGSVAAIADSYDSDVALPDAERLRDDLLASFQELRVSLLDARASGDGATAERSAPMAGASQNTVDRQPEAA